MMEIEVKKDEEKDGKYEEYEIKEACETLVKAEMIKQDDAFMKVLQPYLDDKAKATAKLAGLGSDKKFDPKDGLDGLKKVAREKSKAAAEKY